VSACSGLNKHQSATIFDLELPLNCLLNCLSPKEVALVKRDTQNLKRFQGLAGDFLAPFFAVTQD
jgi:hypothetical protein